MSGGSNTAERRCGTCRFLRVDPDKAGRRVVRKDRAYRCQFEIAWPPLPVSVTRAYGFRLPNPQHQGMFGDMGDDCPTWEAINGK